jgi:hypothetical protein
MKTMRINIASLGILVLLVVTTACGGGLVPDGRAGSGNTTIPTNTTIPPTPTFTPTATPVPSGPCDNPLMSLNVGNQWKYQSTSPAGSSQVSLRVTGWDEKYGLNAVLEMENQSTGKVTSDLVTCLEGGAIEDFPLVFISMLMGDYIDGVLNTYYESGIYSPTTLEYSANNGNLDWEATYLTEEGACFVGLVPNMDLCFHRSTPIDLAFETGGEYEPVTVPAGTYPQALKVTFTFTMATDLIFPNMATGAPLTVHGTQWYAPFVGLLRAEVDSASVALMTGQDTVVPVEGLIELVEFSQTP